MDQFDWGLPNKINISCLRWLGLWPDGDTYKLDLYAMYNFVITFLIIYVFNICQFVKIFLVDDLDEASDIIFVALSALIAIFKIHVFTKNIKMLKQLKQDVKISTFRPRNERQVKLVRPALDVWKNVFIAYCVLASSAEFFMIFFPILDGSVKDSRTPFSLWYPFDATKSPLYEITYLHQSLACGYIGAINVNVDSLIGALMTFVGAQCEILCDDLRHLHEDSKVAKAFINCLNHHRKILKFAEDANKFFDMVVLGQFFTSIVSLALTMFRLTMLTSMTNEFYSVIVYANAITVQIFMYCWFGNEVQLKSNKIPYAAYECDWINLPLQLKKDLMFFIVRTQQPIKFSAIKLFYISVDTFSGILRTAWSYFAVLRNINSS